jgi:hypothetical protein
VFIYTCTNFSFSNKFPETLVRFNRKTKEDILEWYKIARRNDRNTDDEADDLCVDPILIIIEWNDNAFAARNIQKNAVIACMLKITDNKINLFYYIISIF